MQKLMAIGNLGRDPEVRYTNDGTPVANFSVAVSEKYKDQQITEWLNCVAFRRLAEIAGEYLHKGSKVFIEGKLKTNEWEKDGVKRSRTEIVLINFQMLDAKGTRTSAAPPPGMTPDGPQVPGIDKPSYPSEPNGYDGDKGYYPDGDMDEDIPF